MRDRWLRTGMIMFITATLLAGCSAEQPATSPPPSQPTVPSAPPTTSPSAPASPSSSPSPTATPAPPKPTVSKNTLTYFFKIALGAEYGDKTRVVKRWTQPVVSVRVHGTASTASRGCLNRVISDFNALTDVTDLRLTKSGGDIQLYFAPVKRFPSLDPSYVRGNDGFFTVSWSGDYSMYKSRVLIGTTGIPDAIRCHLIREELTQTMGLMTDSNDHPGSVFYGKYLPAPTKYSALDKGLIRLLYSGALKPGDTKKDITEAVTIKP